MSYDISILGEPGNVGNRALLDFNDTVVNGVYKLAQQCLIILFTDKTKEVNGGRGTNIPALVETGANAGDLDQIQNLFNLAATDIKGTFSNFNLDVELPDDENLDKVVFNPEIHETYKDQVSVTMTTTSLAGSETVLKFPITFQDYVEGTRNLLEPSPPTRDPEPIPAPAPPIPPPPPPYSNTKSFLFDGVDESLEHGNVLDTDGDSPFSLSIWFKANAIATDSTFMSHIASPLNGYLFRLDAPQGALEMFISSNFVGGDYLRRRSTTINWDDDTWRLATVTYDGSRNIGGVKIYADGVLTPSVKFGGADDMVGSVSQPTGIFRHAQSGATPWNFTGNLDESSWWSKELSPADITEIYNAGEPKDLSIHTSSSSLVSWWRMGDGKTDDATGTTGQIRDQVGINHGIPINTEAEDIVEDVP